MPKHTSIAFMLSALAALTQGVPRNETQQAPAPSQRTGRIDQPTIVDGFFEDLSHGAVFRFEIAPELPMFTFKLVVQIPDSGEQENGQPLLQAIEVFAGESEQPLQRLTGCDFEGMERPPARSDWFHTDDLNFDGYQDLYLMTSYGATGNQYGCVWLYNPAKARFDYSKEFSELSRYWLDPGTKTIRTFDRGGMVGMVHTANRYKVEHNQPVLIWSESQNWDFEKKRFHCIVQERRNDVMVTARDVWGESGEPACELPSDWFQPGKTKQ